MRRITAGSGTLLFAALLWTPPALAQTADQPTGASVEAGVRGTALLGGFEVLVGGAALLDLHSRFSIGGGGWVLTRHTPIEVASPASDLEMAFGYGGLLVDIALLDSDRAHLALRLLAGAGNARIIVPIVGAEIGWDNFGVLEPELGLTVHLAGPAALRASASYLYSFGVEDLPPLLPEDLRALSAGLSLSVGFR